MKATDLFQVSEAELLLDRLAAAVLETVIDSIFLVEVRRDENL